MTTMVKEINATDLKKNMEKILDEVTEDHVVQIVKRTTTKSNAVILSEETYNIMNNALIELNEAQLLLAQSQFEERDFESFVINDDEYRTYSD